MQQGQATIILNRPAVTDNYGNAVDSDRWDRYTYGPANAVMALGKVWGDHRAPVTLEEFLETEGADLAEGTVVYDFLTTEQITVGSDWCPEHGWIPGECEACADEARQERHAELVGA